MNDNRLYHQWINHRRTTRVPDGFSRQLVKTIENCEPARRFFPHAIGPTIAQRLMRYAAAVSMVLLGIFRLLFVTANFLLGSTL